MTNRFTKLTSILLLSITMLFSSAGVARTTLAEDTADKFIVVHTNDMHGRLNEVPRDSENGDYTLLSRLKYFIETEKPSLVLDGGDAIQGLPISNISKGKYMIDAMVDVGYNMMTVGNHEFDFGYDVAVGLKSQLEGTGMSILSSNVMKGGTLSFKPYEILETGGKKVALIGLTTPETTTKTHPNNVEGVTFLEPITQAVKYIDEILDENNDIDLIVPVGHLGKDLQTKVEWRGNTLAEHLSAKGYSVPILVVDGHSHSTVNPGVMIGDNVLYVQTGEYLNNIGRVEIDFDNLLNDAESKDLQSEQFDKSSDLVDQSLTLDMSSKPSVGSDVESIDEDFLLFLDEESDKITENSKAEDTEDFASHSFSSTADNVLKLDTLDSPALADTSDKRQAPDTPLTFGDDSDIEALDFNIELLEQEVEPLSALAETKAASTNSSPVLPDEMRNPDLSASFADQFAADFEFVDALDSQQITLDLAEQYLQLGEYDSANRLLNEVVAQGNPEQQQQAQALLARSA